MIHTERLVLRPWRESDKPAFTAMSADPRVMDWLGGCLTPEQAEAQVDRLIERIADRGWGVWAVEVIGGPQFIGWTGLSPPAPDHPMAGTVEVGWRLAYDAWGHGYVTEGASASLAYGFERLGLNQIVSFTAVTNLRSRAVMQRIGMSLRPELAFEHPRADLGALRPHVTYAIEAP